MVSKPRFLLYVCTVNSLVPDLGGEDFDDALTDCCGPPCINDRFLTRSREKLSDNFVSSICKHK